jgi:hypothetical protein
MFESMDLTMDLRMDLRICSRAVAEIPLRREYQVFGHILNITTLFGTA